MATLKISILFLALFLMQSSTPHALSDDETLQKKTELLETWLNGHANFYLLCQKYGSKTVRVARKILKDEALEFSQQPNIVKFKNDLNQFVEAFKNSKTAKEYLYALGSFVKTTDYYLKTSENELTEEINLVLFILNKYHVKNLILDFHKEFDPFIEMFKQKYGESKAYLAPSMVEKYERFNHISIPMEKIMAYLSFYKAFAASM